MTASERAEDRIAREGRPAAAFFLVLLCSSFVVSLFCGRLGADLETSVLLHSGLLATVTVIYAVREWAMISPLFRRVKVDVALLVAGPLLALLLAVNWYYHRALDRWLRTNETWWPVLREEASGVVLFATLCVVPAVFEEAAFRGIIQERLVRAVRPWPGILVTSLLFATLHVNLPGAPYLFVLSIYLGWIRMRTRSVYPGMFLHLLHNVVVVFVFA